METKTHGRAWQLYFTVRGSLIAALIDDPFVGFYEFVPNQFAIGKIINRDTTSCRLDRSLNSGKNMPLHQPIPGDLRIHIDEPPVTVDRWSALGGQNGKLPPPGPILPFVDDGGYLAPWCHVEQCVVPFYDDNPGS